MTFAVISWQFVIYGMYVQTTQFNTYGHPVAPGD